MNIIEFLQDSKALFLGTIDENQARVRPISFVMENDGRLFFCTHKAKDLYRQLVSNPNVEICFLDSKMNTLRISSKVIFTTSPDLQEKALKARPMLQKKFSVGDDNFALYYLDEPKAFCQSIKGDRQAVVM